jgi:hypothetical protein
MTSLPSWYLGQIVASREYHPQFALVRIIVGCLRREYHLDPTAMQERDTDLENTLSATVSLKSNTPR